MPRDATDAAARAHGLLAGYLGGVLASHGARAARATLAAATISGDELLSPEPALDRLVQRWWGLDGGTELDEDTAAGLSHLAAGGGPREGTVAGGPATFPLLLPPVALLTFDIPRNLLSASWHLAALAHGSEESRWAAVAVNVTLSRFLRGYRDFVPDVIEALRNNDAPASLLGLARRLPILTRHDIAALHEAQVPAIADAVVALWLAEREAVSARGVAFVNEVRPPGGRISCSLALFMALAGARDARPPGPLALPAPDADIRALALRLARIPHL